MSLWKVAHLKYVESDTLGHDCCVWWPLLFSRSGRDVRCSVNGKRRFRQISFLGVVPQYSLHWAHFLFQGGEKFEVSDGTSLFVLWFGVNVTMSGAAGILSASPQPLRLCALDFIRIIGEG